VVKQSLEVLARFLLAGVLAAGCNSIFGLNPVTLDAGQDSAGEGAPGARDSGVADQSLDVGRDAPRDAAADDAPVDHAVVDAPADPPSADAGADVPTPPPGCQGTKGPTPVNIDGMFCVDSTPVTNAQYADFLSQATPATLSQPAVCQQWNTTFTPTSGYPFHAGVENYPVVYVNYCDAWAYCHWAGKRLCGRVGFPTAAFGDVLSGELYYACSGGATHPHAYSYGDTLDPSACDTDVCVDGSATSSGHIDPVGVNKRCQSIVYPGLYDLNNALEVILDMCETGDASDGSGDVCQLSNPDYCEEECATTGNYLGRSYSSGMAGIRCCSDFD
jgi:hypothetical protein